MNETGRRKRDWTNIIQDWRSSGKSVKEFCRESEIPTREFYRMRKRLNVPETGLVKILPKQNSLVPIHQGLVLEVGTTYRIRIQNGFPAETLKSLLSLLDSI